MLYSNRQNKPRRDVVRVAKKIMVVDEDLIEARTISRAMEQGGYEVMLFTSCTDAQIQVLNTDLVAIVFGSAVEPASENEFVKKMKLNPATSEIPIISTRDSMINVRSRRIDRINATTASGLLAYLERVLYVVSQSTDSTK